LLLERLISHLFRNPGNKWGQVRKLSGTGVIIFSGTYGAILISCIYIRNHINVFPLLEFFSRDVATVMTYSSEENNRELIVTSAYLSYDSDKPPPSKELEKVIDHCSSNRKLLIIRCDANEHHILRAHGHQPKR
jgi:hypothetical protein